MSRSPSRDVKSSRDGAIADPPLGAQESLFRNSASGSVESAAAPSGVEELKRDLTCEIALCDLIGSSPAFRHVLDEVRVLSQTDATVLITGETGTGKDMCARAIHYTSSRASKPFIPVNCGGIPDQLFENEFFGHERGAYTDARDRYRGIVHEAKGGTIFLDDIESLGVKSQAKLLQLLQGSWYAPLGSGKIIKSHARIIAATNEDLQSRVEERTFREDLYFRLAVLTLYLPPLRDRAEDIPTLANVFLERYSCKYAKPGMRISQRAFDQLRAHHWPGNVRELESVIHRAILHASSDVIADIPMPDDTGQCKTTPRKVPSVPPFGQAKKELVTRFERDYILRVLTECGWNISEAARRSGKDRRAFWELMRKHALLQPRR
jgi:DNA-binding NtrC family response regulator